MAGETLLVSFLSPKTCRCTLVFFCSEALCASLSCFASGSENVSAEKKKTSTTRSPDRQHPFSQCRNATRTDWPRRNHLRSRLAVFFLCAFGCLRVCVVYSIVFAQKVFTKHSISLCYKCVVKVLEAFYKNKASGAVFSVKCLVLND